MTSSIRPVRTTAVLVCALAALLLPAAAAEAAQDQPAPTVASAQPVTGTVTGTDDFGWQ
ncbi:hypothetical protein ACH4TP_36155 [Streptomyces sp. NPDC021012]|uniref:hypothetical protein n=1 Tax=Streptomyces sp. NPDC021012 TaxID=3365107 RepID=UPI0037ABB662